MYTSHESSNTNFEQKQLDKKVESDHETALRSEKIGKKLVSKTVKLVDSGEIEKSFFSPALLYGKADPESITLALNSELKRQDIDVKAAITVEAKGMPSDPTYYNLLKITEVEGMDVKSPDNNPHTGSE